jgi:hypothetical protein
MGEAMKNSHSILASPYLFGNQCPFSIADPLLAYFGLLKALAQAQLTVNCFR